MVDEGWYESEQAGGKPTATEGPLIVSGRVGEVAGVWELLLRGSGVDKLLLRGW